MPSDPLDQPAWRQPLPPQSRGRLRRERIVAAARDLIDAHGPHSPEVTIRSISDRAHSSAATIYHYFVDMDALVATVTIEYMDTLIELVQTAIRDNENRAPSGLLDQLIASYRDYFAAHPGLRELWFDQRATPTVIEIHTFYRTTVAAMMRTAMAKYTETPGTELDHSAILAMAGALWELAFSVAPEGDETIVKQIRQVMTDYWRRQFGVVVPLDAEDGQRDSAP